MALSNWFIVAWDEEGNNILEIPEIEIPAYKNLKGYRIKIHKNWMYIFPSGDKPYNKRIITVYNGKMDLPNIYIETKRGNQNSIYVIITYFTGKKRKMKRIFVIAGYGFKPSGPHIHDLSEELELEPWVGCLPETVTDFKEWVNQILNPELYEDKDWCIEFGMELSGKAKEDIIKELEKNRKVILFKKAICQNQGDIYFNKRLGLEKQFHKVGKEPPRPYFELMLEGMKTDTTKSGTADKNNN